MKINKSRPDFSALIAEFEAGGFTQRQFCQLKKIKLPTFQSWLYKIRKRGGHQNNFLPVRVLHSESEVTERTQCIEIQFLDGTVIKFSGRPEPVLIKQFLPAFTQ